MDCEARGDWLDCFGSQTVTLKCDNEPAILALAQEIRRLRREGSITIFEHPEEWEKQSDHLAEGSVKIVKGHQNLQEQHGDEVEDRDWPVSSADTTDHRTRRTAQEQVNGGRQRQISDRGREAEEFSVLCVRLVRKSCSCLLLLPDEETLAQGSTVGSTCCRTFDGQAYIGTPSGVIRCRTLRQLSAPGRWDTEFVLTIKGTPWSPDGERAGDVTVWISLRLEVTGVRIRQILTHHHPQENAPHQGDVREAWSHRPMLGLPCHSNRNWVPSKPHCAMPRNDWAGA